MKKDIDSLTVQSSLCVAKNICCVRLSLRTEWVRCFEVLKIDLMINASAQARSRGIDRFA